MFGRFGSKAKAVAAAGALVLAGAALGATVPAMARGSRPSTLVGSVPAAVSPAPLPPLPPVPPELQGPLFGVVSGELQLTKYDGTTMTLEYDRGRITSISDSQITLLRLDGESVTVTVDEATWVREGFALGSVNNLTVGQGAMLFSETTDGGLHAVLIRCVTPPPRAGAGAPV